MEQNRQVWLDQLMKLEGGYVNNPADPGRATNYGVTVKTLSDWRGEDCNVEDVTGLTESEARDIMIAKYWQVMRGDQLPSGLDCYVCDMAVNSGPGRAAKILQALVDTKVDSFVGPRTIEAVRKKDPLQLLLSYHSARMEFLVDLPTWDTFGRGWTRRCAAMLDLAKARIQARPGLAEAAGSKIITTNAPTAALSAGGLAWAVSEYGPAVLRWLNEASADPATLEKLNSGVQYINTVGNLPLVVLVLGGLLTLSLGTNVLTVWWRNRMWTKGET